MAEILLTPETLQDAAGKLTNAQNNQSNMLATVQRIVDTMVEGWEGKAQEAFIAAFNAAKGTYQEFSADMTSFSEFLRNFSATMRDSDLGAGQRIGQ